MDFKLILFFTITGSAVYGANIPQQLVSAAATRSASSDDSGLGIYGGQNTTIEKNPYVTNLIIYNGRLNCSATIVSDQWLATLADCVYGVSTKDMKVVAGSNDGGSGQIFLVILILVHPKYNDFDYDLALVKIAGTFTWSEKIKAVKLPKSEAKDNTTMITAGYGKTSASNGWLMQGKMKWLPHKTCKNIYDPYVLAFTDRMNCAYSPKTTCCKGDWANAFVRRKVFYGMFAAGISANFCTRQAQPNLLISIFPMAEWIHNNTGAVYDDEF